MSENSFFREFIGFIHISLLIVGLLGTIFDRLCPVDVHWMDTVHWWDQTGRLILKIDEANLLVIFVLKLSKDEFPQHQVKMPDRKSVLVMVDTHWYQKSRNDFRITKWKNFHNMNRKRILISLKNTLAMHILQSILLSLIHFTWFHEWFKTL